MWLTISAARYCERTGMLHAGHAGRAYCRSLFLDRCKRLRVSESTTTPGHVRFFSDIRSWPERERQLRLMGWKLYGMHMAALFFH